MEVKYPDMRTRLAGNLQDLSNPLLQWRCWIDRQDYPGFPGLVFSHSETINTFFDFVPYGDLDECVEKMLGVTLKTQEEVQTIKVLANALHAVINATGKMASDRETITHSLWTDVIAAAREALDAFTRAEYGYPVKR